MSLEADLTTLRDYLRHQGEGCCPEQDIPSNCRKLTKKLSAKKPTEAKVYFRYVTDQNGELIMDCTFKVQGMFFGFWSIRRCEITPKWSKNGRYYLTPMFGTGNWDTGAITGLAQAKALATLNTRIMMAAMQNVTLK